MFILTLRFLLAISLCTGTACKSPETVQTKDLRALTSSSTGQEPELKKLAYDLSSPSTLHYLDNSLIEISGLSYANDGLVAINDEKGNIYSINASSGESKKIMDFAKDGDYEGIANVNDRLVVLKSNGHLYFTAEDEESTELIKTSLKQENDVEGLCFEPKTNSLLLACKGATMDHEKSKSTKKIYSFDLGIEKVNDEARFTIRDEDLFQVVERSNREASKTTLKQLKSRAKSFAPSGIAIDPIDNFYYILSARGSLLVVLNRSGNLKSVSFLNPSTIAQPEGICFDPKGTLYISTEGNNAKAKLFSYDRM